ncbi:MAG: hypothetical protein HW397_570, partial [Dehalococcoidia bacterium]|nr:hypothetical protein [Dehalococcoidia bacterium]
MRAMKSLLSPSYLARISARHPKLVVLVWALAVLLSGVVASQLLAGVLTTEIALTSNPESKRAQLIL